VILPKQNEKDLEDVPEEVIEALRIVLVERIDEVFDVALESEEEEQGEAS
jgi:ATP-dependent Lon protease